MSVERDFYSVVASRRREMFLSTCNQRGVPKAECDHDTVRCPVDNTELGWGRGREGTGVILFSTVG